MIAHNIIVGLSIIASLLIYFLTGQYTTWYYAFFLLAYFAAAYIAIILLYMLFIAVLSWFMQRKDTPEEPNKFFYGIIRETAMFLLFMSRCKIKKVGTNLEPKERYLLVTNHQSNYDPIIVFKCLKNNPLVCVTKPEVMKKPVIGKWVRYSGFIPIERDDLVQAAGAINTAAKYIKMARETVAACVTATNQTFVETLKQQGKFDKESQEEAFRRTKDAVLSILTTDAQTYLIELVGDIDVYLNSLIEAQVNTSNISVLPIIEA